MSTRLTDEQRERIRCDYERWGDTRAAKHIPTLLSHCTALEEELKAAQDKMLSQVSVMKQYGVDEVNNFRARLVEAMRVRNARKGWMDKSALAEVVQLIQTFELEK